MSNKKSNEKRIQMIKDWAASQGYNTDSYGKTFSKLVGEWLVRIKIKKTSVRVERRVKLSNGKRAWWKISCGNIKDIYISKDNKLEGLH